VNVGPSAGHGSGAGRSSAAEPPVACDICRIHESAAQPGSEFAALECHRGQHWIVRHHPLPAPLVGWTFLCAERHVQGAADFSDAEADGFGRALRTVSRAIREITGCDRVYAIAFGQGAPHLHMHLIPRFDAVEATRAWQVADWYRAVERGEHAPADPVAVAHFVGRLREILVKSPLGKRG
jgi:diadenosine tetraphosphate (Ap4A) HIT family hydrolase